MSILVDADKIIDSLGNSDMDFAIGAVIDEQPTAFDVDEVVRQIKDIKDKEYAACLGPECGYCRYLSTCSYEDKAVKLALERAVEIVKSGGIKWVD